MYPFLIFDWDGTLIDSADRIVSSMQAAARELEMPELPASAVQNIIGLGLPEALRELFPGISDDQIQTMRERYSHHYLSADGTPAALFPGVEEGLRTLASNNVVLAVATGKSRRGLEQAFEDTGLGSLFSFSRCADETRSKPHPQMLHELLSESGFAAHQSLMVGDSEFDLAMAKQASIDSAAVTYGVHAIERLKRHDPVVEAGSFSELMAWLAGQTAMSTQP